MKALVLSGGAGTRLRPITHTSAEQLVPVANKPVLFHGLESLAEAGVTEVGMIVGDTAAEIEDAVGDGSKFGLRVTCIPQEQPLGPAHAVLTARDRRGELEITHALQHLIDSRADVRCTVVQGYWKDTGNVVDMPEVNRSVLEGAERRIDGQADDRSETNGRVVVEEGARIVDSRIAGPAVIGAGTIVSDSCVGPFTSVAENRRITDSELEFPIVLRDSSIDGVGRIEASLIGRHVEVTPAPSVSSAHRLVLGDHSKAQIHS